eukprot:6209697-Pleurochrysis_carterae.AAC.1
MHATARCRLHARCRTDRERDSVWLRLLHEVNASLYKSCFRFWGWDAALPVIKSYCVVVIHSIPSLPLASSPQPPP